MFVRLSLLLAVFLGLATPADAQDYPNRPVKVIVPFAAGGPADIIGRYMAQYLTEHLGQPFVVEDRPGAGSVIGTDAAAKSPADGYTLLMISSAHTTNESLIKNKPYDLMRDFVGIAPVNVSDLVMVVHPSVPANDLKEFIALAKAKPGQLNYASSGPGTPYHMAGELFKAMSGTDIVHVPYKGSSGARTDLIGGQVQMMFDAIITMAPAVEARQARALGTTGLKRSAVLPDIPTLAEAGVPGYEAVIWLGVMAPAGTPKSIVELLNREINKMLASDEVKKLFAQQGSDAIAMTAAEYEKFLRADIVKWAEVVRISGAKVE